MDLDFIRPGLLRRAGDPGRPSHAGLRAELLPVAQELVPVVGLGGQTLTDRARLTRQALADMHREYEYTMQDKPRLERAPRDVDQPVRLSLGVRQ